MEAPFITFQTAVAPNPNPTSSPGLSVSMSVSTPVPVPVAAPTPQSSSPPHCNIDSEDSGDNKDDRSYDGTKKGKVKQNKKKHGRSKKQVKVVLIIQMDYFTPCTSSCRDYYVISFRV